MLYAFEPTIGLGDEPGGLRRDQLKDLQRIMPRFFVPLLEEKPQNPIMESLKLEEANTNLPPRPFRPQRLPDELAVLSLEPIERPEKPSSRTVQELWNAAASRKPGIRNGLLSWDRLRYSHSNAASPTAFLSEQDQFIYASARHHIQPRLYHSTDSIRSVTVRELLACLKCTVLGIASQLHTWDFTLEKFIQIGTENNRMKGVLLVDGKDNVVSSSLISRFLTIGTLLRRLELLLSSLRTRSAQEGPTIHALAHSLSTTLDYIRHSLVECPPSNSTLSTTGKNICLSEIWSQYDIYEDLLIALAELYGRDESLPPDKYVKLESSPVPLLSRIYDSLASHFERQSPALVRAIIASILTTASQEYIQEVARSIGYGGQPMLVKTKRQRSSDAFDMDEDEDEEEEDVYDLLDAIEITFPTFFPQKILQLLPAAQKSLVLFRIAQPDHPLLTSPSSKSSVRWLWSDEAIDAAWNDISQPSEVPTSPTRNTSIVSPSPSKNNPELLDFRIFDLEPGVHANLANDTSSANLRLFINKFPQKLPSITPTLTELTSLAFKDLMQHASTLSSTLLSLFINSPGKLNFRSHLILLRSYLLVADPSFKSRLVNALFSDSGDYEVDTTAHSMSIRSLRRRSSQNNKARTKESNQPWAVGLSPNLLERGTWPPVGADLSFFLRTVIVDSLDKGKETEEGKIERDGVVEEAEWRLGFAIRDLPTGPGRDKWLDPLSIEALDFLYMDYKPPRPLEILISPDILSKYQRMFAFLLRLLRVENALKTLFRMSTHRIIDKFLFPTLAQSRKKLLHFRFVSQAFVSSLSGYVFDTAIGGNFDPFITRLSPDDTVSDSKDSDPGFSDVFELAQCHSTLLDDILSACLLRSGQRGVGDLLRQSLELVLEFTIVIGELNRGRIQEYQAAPMVEELYRKFCGKMTTLTKVLKGLVDKSPSSSKLSLDSYAGGRRRPTGGLNALYHLLIRLDLTDWWDRSSKDE